MLTFSFNTSLHLIGCGVDGETIARFSPFLTEDHPFPFVFSPEEIAHARSLDDPATGLCAAFCCKEAVLKAIGKPINYTDCRFFYEVEKEVQKPVFSASDDFSIIADSQVRIISGSPGELVAIVHLFSAIHNA